MFFFFENLSLYALQMSIVLILLGVSQNRTLVSGTTEDKCFPGKYNEFKT